MLAVSRTLSYFDRHSILDKVKPKPSKKLGDLIMHVALISPSGINFMGLTGQSGRESERDETI